MQVKIGYIYFLLLLLVGTVTKAQNLDGGKPLPLRNITGKVLDSTKIGLPGVTVKLFSATDTIVAITNQNGSFGFKNVKSASYTLSANMLGFAAFVGKFKQNAETSEIAMDPIILKDEASLLKEVTVNGTPSITYKTDTVEYKANDYKVRENATVDELVKKMEGMEVGTDGSLVHQGNPITKAKINGKVYLGGDVAQALQNLPAEIVEKIQIVDDYGDEAARTGVKDGEPEKVVNIVTRSDKSVGNTARISGGAGSNSRYEGSIFGTRINGNQTIGLNARLNNTINGVANSGDNGSSSRGGNRGGGSGNSASGGSGGTTKAGGAGFSYRDKLGKKVEINTNYRFNFNNVNTLNSSVSQIFSSNGTIFANNDGERNNNSKSHSFSFELEANLDSANYLKVTPNFSYNSTFSDGQSTFLQKGLIHQDQISSNFSNNTRPSFGATVFYQHLFKKPKRNLSLQLSFNDAKNETAQDRSSNIIYYQDESDLVLKDSLVHRLVDRDNATQNYRASLTYVEPVTSNSQIEFNGQIMRNAYQNTALTGNIDAFGNYGAIDSLSNIYDYSFTQGRLSLNYRFGTDRESKFKFSMGVTAVPALLSGTKASLGTSINRQSLNIIPIAKFQYLWSRQHKLQLNYSGNAVEPTFDQIQPVRDVSNPQNPIVGNPDLKVTFNHSVRADYDNYIAASKLNYSVNVNASFTNNAVARNTVQIADAYGSLKNETRYINIDGVYRVNSNYSISKQLADRKYNLSFSGNVMHNHGVSMSNNVKNITSTWSLQEKFGPRINPNEWLEVNPNVSYSFIKSNNTLPTSINSRTNTLAFGIDGRFIMWESLIFGYSANKNFVSGINANVTNNPFVINSYITKEMWHRRATLTLQAFDILNQNNFVNRSITDEAITDTKSNALSRYFMLRFSMRLQKWSGMKGRGGRPAMRRGDGSFYE